MKFSVVVAAYNEEDNIGVCLDSILETDYPRKDYEVIVVDDGSTDKTPKIAGKYGKKHGNIRLISKENAGKASALNTGLKHARGEYILVTDSDACVPKDWFSRMGESLLDSDMVQGSCVVGNIDGFWGKIQRANSLIKFKYSKPIGVYPMGANNGFRKMAALDVGGFNEKTADVTSNFIWKLKNRDYTVSYNPDIVVYVKYPNNMLGFIEQRLRWREYYFPKQKDIPSIIYILQHLYVYGIPVLLNCTLLLWLLTGNPQLLLIFPLAIAVDIILYSKAITKIFLTPERKWIPYFLLYYTILTITVRLMLPTYIIYRIFNPRKKPTFKTIYK
jgi:glycosyltransferase involved in cell wall biosynthesis